MTEELNKILNEMPKVELHIHLEGSIPSAALWELFKKYDSKKEIKSIEELERKFEYTDFPHFIETWVWKNKFINEYDDFTFIASEVKKDLATQNIIYSEMFYSPPDFHHKKLEPQRITEAIVKGFEQASGNTKIYLCADVVRDFGAVRAMETLHQIREVKDLGVPGIGIGGSEHAFPPEIFEEVYEKAREFGFRTSAHAGEAAGAESVWGAVKTLKAERIGHGTRAFEDERLVEFLRDNKIPVETCPLSNLRTGVVKKIEEHPVKDYYKKGLIVFLNTDDPKMFNNTLAEEYEMFIEKMGFGLSDVKKLMNNAIDSAWCGDKEKLQVRKQVNEYFNNIL
jgi:adenosine deaminase